MSPSVLATINVPAELEDESRKVIKWLTREGEWVAASGRIAEFQDASNKKLVVKAPIGGIVRHAVKIGEPLPTGHDRICILEECIHPEVWDKLCTLCCQPVASNNAATKIILGGGHKMTVSQDVAAKMDIEKFNHKLKVKKLTLILDLDHTLLHATDDPRAGLVKSEDIHSFMLRNHGTGNKKLYVKLRPFATGFLQSVSKLFQLHIYTHGTREYAEEIAKIIDPSRSLFSDRIVTRSDTPDIVHKSLRRLFPSCDDSMVVIVDDRDDVWKDSVRNVVLVEPYHFFTGMHEVNNQSGQSLVGTLRSMPGSANTSKTPPTEENQSQVVKEQDDKMINSKSDQEANITSQQVEKTDDQLYYTAFHLECLHEMFFAGLEELTGSEQLAGKGKDVKALLQAMRNAVFDGCVVAFSGVFRLDDPHPELSPLWKSVERFGARCTKDLNIATHLVAKNHTDKAKKALKAGILKVVSLDWLFASMKTWQRQDEEAFSLGSEILVHREALLGKSPGERRDKVLSLVGKIVAKKRPREQQHPELNNESFQSKRLRREIETHQNPRLRLEGNSSNFSSPTTARDPSTTLPDMRPTKTTLPASKSLDSEDDAYIARLAAAEEKETPWPAGNDTELAYPDDSSDDDSMVARLERDLYNDGEYTNEDSDRAEDDDDPDHQDNWDYE